MLAALAQLWQHPAAALHVRRRNSRSGPPLCFRLRFACEDRSRWLALLPGVVADLSHSSVFCSTGEGLAGRSGS